MKNSKIKKGDKFGEWVVLGPSDKPNYFICKCSCGTVKDVYGSSLIKGTSKSCGCKSVEKNTNSAYKKTDEKVLGKKFGRLKPVKRISEEGRSTYLCECDCGNTCEVKGAYLLSGSVKSCGCLRSETSRKLMIENIDKGTKALKRSLVEDTSLLSLTEKISKNNTSGVKGVSFHKKSGKYRAYITFKGKQIHLGVYDRLDEARKARIEGEKKYFKPILDRYKDK